MHPLYTAALLTIAKVWKRPKCPSTNECINKIWCAHTHTQANAMEYYSAMRKTESAITYIWNLKNKVKK